MTTIKQKLEISEQQSRRTGLEAAIFTSNYPLAALNCRQDAKCRPMRGLIQRRRGVDPLEVFEPF